MSMFRVKYSREAVMKILYVVDVLNLDDQLTAEELWEIHGDLFKGITKWERKFILKILRKVLKEQSEIDDLISRNLIGWKLERLMAVDRALLRMGVAESYFNDQKPIIIDDIVRIAKKYGSEESYKIINAVLDKVIQ